MSPQALANDKARQPRLLAAAAARGSDHASDWFSARAEMAQEVPLESYDEHDDERNMLIVEGEEDQTDPLERET